MIHDTQNVQQQKPYGLHVAPLIITPEKRASGKCERVIKNDGAIVTEERQLPTMTDFAHDEYEHLFQEWCMTTMNITVPDNTQANVIINSRYTAGISAEGWTIAIGENSVLTLTEKSTGQGDVIRRFHVDAKKNSTATIITMSTLQGINVRRSTSTIAEKGRVDHHEFLNNKNTFGETFHTLNGKKAKGTITITFKGTGTSHADIHASSNHSSPETTSNITIRGTLDGTARADIIGDVTIQPTAERSSGYQSSSVLLLSPTATTNMLPNLNIHNHDVTCSHSASATTIDEEHVHYLQSRGVPVRIARTLIAEGFLTRGIQTLPDSARALVREVLEERYEQ